VNSKCWKRSLPLLIIIPLLVGVLSGLFLSALAAARERARRTKCTSNLSSFLYACHLYTGDNDELFPPDCDVLFGDYVADGELFLCPSASKATELLLSDFRRPGSPGSSDASGSIHAEHTDYVYVSGLTASDPPDYVVAFDDEWNHEGKGVCFVYIGGQRSWTPDIESIHEQLAKQKREVAARGREMKLVRPKWSSWPDPSASDDPRAGPRMGRSGTSLLAGAVAALIVALLIVVLDRAQPSRPGKTTPKDTGPEGPPKE
jgi:hypothetical protein